MKTLRICKYCKLVLPLTFFNNRQHVCKFCKRVHDKNYYQIDSVYRENVKKRARLRAANMTTTERRNRNRESTLNYYHTHKEKFLNGDTSYRFRRRNGINENVWKTTGGHCSACGVLLVKEKGKYAVHHLNGNKFDNSIKNLVLLCTSCHLHVYHGDCKANA